MVTILTIALAEDYRHSRGPEVTTLRKPLKLRAFRGRSRKSSAATERNEPARRGESNGAMLQGGLRAISPTVRDQAHCWGLLGDNFQRRIIARRKHEIKFDSC